jgi:hypothetical protein
MGRIADRVSSAIAGDTTYRVTHKPDGTVDVSSDPSTRGEKWGRIAAIALGGAFKGLAAGQGPGGAEKAAAAGGQFGMQLPQQMKENVEKDATEEQKRQLAQANIALTHQKMMANVIDLREGGIRLSKEESDLFNNLHDQMQKSNGYTELARGKDMADVMQQHARDPNFLQNLTDPDVRTATIADTQGNPTVVMFKTDPGTMGRKNDKPEDVPRPFIDPKTGELTTQFDTYNPGTEKLGVIRAAQAAGTNAVLDAKKKQADADKAEKDTPDKNLATYQAAAVKARMDAEKEPDPAKKQTLLNSAAQYDRLAAQHQAAGRTTISTAPATAPGTQISDLIKPGGAFADGTIPGTMAYKLAHHEATLDEIPKRYGKGQLTPQDYVAGAEAISQRDYSLPYDPTMIKQEEKMFDNLKTQGTLDGIDKMIGVGSQPGYLDTVVTLAEKAGITNLTAPIQDVRRAIKTKFGDSAMKDFNSALSEVQRNLPTLIGNPLIGGSDSDLKQKAAEKAFGQDITLSNLKSNSQIFKTMMEGSKESLTRNNRFLQDRYGQKGPGGGGGGGGAAATGPTTGGPNFQAMTPPPNEPTQPGRFYGKGPKGLGWYK